MRKIIHVDMDCFYAAVEMKERPELQNVPLAVGGSPTGKGVLCTANYQARKFGVRSAMSAYHALKLCPNLVFVKPRFHLYQEYSRKTRMIFERYTNVIEFLSLDEAYLDVSNCSKSEGVATNMALEIRRAIQSELGVTASAGIAENKLLAKIASEWCKPNGQFTIPPWKAMQIISEVDVKALWGIGPKTYEKCKRLGILKCKDMQELTIPELTFHFGDFGPKLYDYCRGKDERNVSTSRVRKGRGVQRTFNPSLGPSQAHEALDDLFEELSSRSGGEFTDVSTFGVNVRYPDFSQTQSQFQRRAGDSPEEILKELHRRLHGLCDELNLDVRRLGVSLRYRDDNPKQLKLFEELP